jgi:putative acetyltransferase
VHADWQRRGVGRAIIKELLAEARRSGTPQLFSHVSITARPFFESQGFCVEAAQRVIARGVEFINFRMSRQLLELNGRQQS